MIRDEVILHSGNKNLAECLKIAVLSTYLGTPIHIHATGLRGIGKTTVIRGMRGLLPQIERIKGCEFNKSWDFIYR